MSAQPTQGLVAHTLGASPVPVRPSDAVKYEGRLLGACWGCDWVAERARALWGGGPPLGTSTAQRRRHVQRQKCPTENLHKATGLTINALRVWKLFDDHALALKHAPKQRMTIDQARVAQMTWETY